MPESANPNEVSEAVAEALSKQFGQPTGGSETWKNLGETKTNITLRDVIFNTISIELRSDMMETQTTAAQAKRLAELQKPAPVTGTLE